MATTHLLSLCDLADDQGPALVLLFPDRVDAPGMDAHRKAVALAAAFGTLKGGFAFKRLQDMSGQTVATHAALFPCGSWMALPTDRWSGQADTTLVWDGDRLDGVVDGPVGRGAFFLPDLCPTSLHPILSKPVVWHDSVPAAVLVGAIDALGSVPFHDPSHQARFNPSWLVGLLLACARVLKPWLGDARIPTRGHDSRPFPASSSVDRTEHDLVDWFASPETDAPEADTSRACGFVQHLVRARLLAPNAPYAPTAWIPGPGWATFRGALPPSLVDAGRRCAPFLPGFEGRSMEELVAGMPHGLTAHAQARWNAPFVALAHVLSQTDAAYVRPSAAVRAAAVQRIRERA